MLQEPSVQRHLADPRARGVVRVHPAGVSPHLGHAGGDPAVVATSRVQPLVLGRAGARAALRLRHRRHRIVTHAHLGSGSASGSDLGGAGASVRVRARLRARFIGVGHRSGSPAAPRRWCHGRPRSACP
eukprot:scaffold10356_cov61-Phaeocystis_antarctica.AAC.6